MISASRTGASRKATSCRLISCFQSGTATLQFVARGWWRKLQSPTTNEKTPTTNQFAPQRNSGVYLGSAARRQVTRNQCDEGQKERNAAEDERVGRAHAVKQLGQQTGHAPGGQ